MQGALSGSKGGAPGYGLQPSFQPPAHQFQPSGAPFLCIQRAHRFKEMAGTLGLPAQVRNRMPVDADREHEPPGSHQTPERLAFGTQPECFGN